MKHLIVAIILTLSAWSVTYAAPTISSISGVAANGQPITITGSGFGTKSNVSPRLRDTFSMGSSGDLLSSHGWTIDSDNPANDKPQLSTTILRHNNSVFSAKFHFTRASYPLQDLASQTVTVSGTKRYADYWMYYKMPQQDSGQPKHQLKLFKLATNGPDEPTINTYAWRQADSSRTTYWPVHTTPSTMNEYYTGNHFADGAWVHVKMIIDVGTLNNSNGVLKVYKDETSTINQSSVPYIVTGYESLPWLNTVQIGKYLGNTDYDPNSETTIYYSEVYYDDTWSRVEICDASTYTSSTHCEIQIPQNTWNDNQVEVSINQGSFSTGTTAYVYISDSSGGLNSTGYSVTLGVFAPNKSTASGRYSIR